MIKQSSSRIKDVYFIFPVQHTDNRGCLAEIYRREWGVGKEPVQWNLVHSAPGTLRGVHVHIRHYDYLLLLEGEALFALHDLRKSAGSYRQTECIRVGGQRPQILSIPPGVAHGFCFYQPSLHIYGVSDYFNLDDELGCHWQDPGLGIDWGIAQPLLSERDQEAASLQALIQQLDAYQADFQEGLCT